MFHSLNGKINFKYIFAILKSNKICCNYVKLTKEFHLCAFLCPTQKTRHSKKMEGGHGNWFQIFLSNRVDIDNNRSEI